MNVQIVLEELDRLFNNKNFSEVEAFLQLKLAEAKKECDDASLITLTNELIGFYRDTSQFEKAVFYCESIISFMDELSLTGTLPFATTLLNVANAYRAAGKLNESFSHYETVLSIYDTFLENSDFRYASYYNNLSLLYQEKEDFLSACKCLHKALDIVMKYPEANIELAVTHTNLASSLLKCNQLEEALNSLNIALSIFEKEEQKDFHYSGALSAMGEALYQKQNYKEAARYYEKALEEINSNVGETAAYQITKHNLQKVYEKLDTMPLKGMQLCRQFYEEFGKPMLMEKFPDYMDRIAVGLVGEGSECFGFDDEISHDHDFGPGFCMWLSMDTYSKIGKQLQEEYEKLPKTYRGITRKITHQGKHRVGVFEIGEFYHMLIGRNSAPATELEFMVIPEERLATAINGEVFIDSEGIFSTIRSAIKNYYPDSLWRKKLAQTAALMSQSGQYNYERAAARKDDVAAQLALAEFVRNTMQMVYLLNHTYAPFYKWMHKGLSQMPVLSEISELLSQQCDASFEEKLILIEKIASLTIREWNTQGLSNHADSYLEHHTPVILNGPPVEQIVRLEWEAFDKVQNEDGRADCQSDFVTFSIMRKSQYLTWPENLLLSYIQDFHNALSEGRNLISEKYAWMMESTSPESFRTLKNRLPSITEEDITLMEEIILIQVEWMEEFAKTYPHLAKQARNIHTSQDNRWNTSYETYLRGELRTYSNATLFLYGQFIITLANENKNLAAMTMQHTASFYGYSSLEAAEAQTS